MNDDPGVRELYRQVPALRGRLPHIPLGNYPTRLERLEALERAARLAPGTELWVKRDDLAGEPFGTSKARKLEHVLGAARAAGASALVTVGPLGSNHALATAIYAREAGFRCLLQLWPEPVTERVRQTLLAEHALGARIEVLGGADERSLAALADAPRALGGAYFVPPAGTDPVGATGYVECALELAHQVQDGAMPPPDALLVAGGTGGVAAGLAVGLALTPVEIAGRRVTAVRAVAREVLSPTRLCMLAYRVHARLAGLAGHSLGGAPGLDAFAIIDDQAGAGYGAPTDAAREAADLFRDAAGLVLDPVYTAKAAAGVLAYARSAAGRGRRILFLHTYGERDLAPLVGSTRWLDLPPAVQALALPPSAPTSAPSPP